MARTRMEKRPSSLGSTPKPDAQDTFDWSMLDTQQEALSAALQPGLPTTVPSRAHACTHACEWCGKVCLGQAAVQSGVCGTRGNVGQGTEIRSRAYGSTPTTRSSHSAVGIHSPSGAAPGGRGGHQSHLWKA